MCIAIFYLSTTLPIHTELFFEKMQTIAFLRLLCPLLALMVRSEQVNITISRQYIFPQVALHYIDAAPGKCCGLPRAWEQEHGYTKVIFEGLRP